MTIDLTNYESYLLDYLEGNLSKELLVEMELFLADYPQIAEEIGRDSLPKLNADEITAPNFSGLVQPLVWEEKEVERLLLNSLENQLELNDLSRLTQFKSAFPLRFKKLEKLISSTQIPQFDLMLSSEFKEGLTQLDLSASSAKLIAFTEGDLDTKERAAFQTEINSNFELQKELKVISALKLTPDTSESLSDEFKNSLKQEKSGLIIPIWFKRSAVAAVVLFGLFLVPLGGDKHTAYKPRTEESSVAEFNYKREQKSEGESTIATPGLTQDATPSHELETPDYKAANNPNQLAEKPVIESKELQVIEPMRSKTYELASTVTPTPNKLVQDHITVDLDFSAWSDSDLAEEPVENEIIGGVTLVELAELKTKETLGEKDEDNLAVAFVNSGAKKMFNTDEDVLAYEKSKEKGFKFTLGKLSIERIK